MMSKEAMKLALEALEESLGYVEEEAENAQRLYGQYPARQARIQGLKDDVRKHMKAITALREALAEQPAPVQQEPVSFLDWYDNAHWGNEDFKAGCWRAWDAALAQRTWVGLTDEERKRVRNTVGYNQLVTAGEYAEHVQKATEAKLKEKNT